MPFDLATVFKIKGIDPDIRREDFAGLSDQRNFKHNALWDARVSQKCLKHLLG